MTDKFPQEMPEQPGAAAHSPRMRSIMVLAFTVAIIIYGAIGLFLAVTGNLPKVPDTPPWMPWAFMAAGVAVLPVLILLKGIRDPVVEANAPDTATRWRLTVAMLALAEAPALMGLLALFMGAPLVPFLVMVGLGLIFLNFVR